MLPTTVSACQQAESSTSNDGLLPTKCTVTMNALAARIELLQEENEDFQEELQRIRNDRQKVELRLTNAKKELAIEKKDREHFEKLCDKQSRELELGRRKVEAQRKASIIARQELENEVKELTKYATGLEKELARHQSGSKQLSTVEQSVRSGAESLQQQLIPLPPLNP